MTRTTRRSATSNDSAPPAEGDPCVKGYNVMITVTESGGLFVTLGVRCPTTKRYSFFRMADDALPPLHKPGIVQSLSRAITLIAADPEVNQR